MGETRIDLDTWPRAAAYRFFRTFEQPHFSVTTRLDVTHLLSRKEDGVSPFRACLYAFAKGFHAVPDLRTRFRADDVVVRHDRLTLSPTIALPDGTFGFGYIEYDPDWRRFDAAAQTEIEAVRDGATRDPASGEKDGYLFLSCLPWIDFSAMTNAFPSASDCIPRISWGKFVTGRDGRTTCAFTAELHHAVCDGVHLAQAVDVIQSTLDSL